MSDAAVRLCPSCGEEQVERLISTGGGIVFKGPGFYATDYRQGADRGGKSAAAKGSDGGSDGGSDRGSDDGSDDGSSRSREGASSRSGAASSGSSEGDSGS